MTDGAQLQQMEGKLDRLIDSIDGNEKKDIKGLRPRMHAVEAKTDKLIDMVERGKHETRIATLEKLVEVYEEERKVNRAWIKGLAVGLGVTTVSSLSAFALQLINSLSVAGGP
jgi:hypothetical protein